MSLLAYSPKHPHVQWQKEQIFFSCSKFDLASLTEKWGLTKKYLSTLGHLISRYTHKRLNVTNLAALRSPNPLYIYKKPQIVQSIGQDLVQEGWAL